MVHAGNGHVDLPGAQIGRLALTANASAIVVDATAASIAELSGVVNVGSLSISLPANSDLVGSLRVGGGRLEVCLPPDVGLRITSRGQPRQVTVNGLRETGSDWQSPGYASATHTRRPRCPRNFGTVEINPIGGCNVNRRLYRCRHDRLLAGVAGGVAEFFDLDPTLVRVLWFLSIFFGGLGTAVYIGMAHHRRRSSRMSAACDDGEAAVERRRSTATRPAATGAGRRVRARADPLRHARPGRSFLPALDVEHVFVPVIVIGIGVLLVARALRREPMES